MSFGWHQAGKEYAEEKPKPLKRTPNQNLLRPPV